MPYMDCMLPLDEVYEALKCFCLQWETACPGEKGQGVEKKGKDRDAAVAGERFGIIPL